MPTFQCKKCGKTTEAETEECCSPNHICKAGKPPECCGHPMIEIMAD